MPELVFLGPRTIRHPPAALTVARGGLLAAIRAFPRQMTTPLWLVFYVAFRLLADSAHMPGWERGGLLVIAIYLALLLVTDVRAFIAAYKADSPLVTMDGSGLVCSLPKRRSWQWWDVKACACRNEKGRRTLRLFLSGRAKLKVDIDFALAAEPKRSLDEAMLTCAAWIAAARDPADTESPIREFVDEHAASRKLLYTVAVLCVAALIVLGVLRSL